MSEDKNTILQIKDLDITFRTTAGPVHAIRGVNIDLQKGETVAIVGESGSGKSVFTKTFAGMLDSNGFIDNGKIIFSDEELSDTVVKLNDNAKKVIAENKKKLDEYSRLEFGADTYKAILELESEKRRRADLSEEETAAYEKKLHELKHERTNTFNLKQTYDPSKEKDKIKEAGKKISELDTKIRAFEKEHEQKVKERANSLAHDTAYNQEFDKKMAELKAKHAKEVSEAISAETEARNEILAKEVPDIDLIISGHTHSELKEAIQHGNTYIVSCGEYGRNLGSLSMTQKQDGRWELTSYELIPVSEDVKPDRATQEQIDALMDTVDKNYLADFGYTREEVLAENDVEFNSLEEMGTKHEELNLGDIMSDAYIYAVENSEYYDGDPVDVAVVPSGTVRDTYTKGDITVEDVFNSFSLGIGKDGVAGYPLISAYLTGKELKLAAEVDASVSDFMTTARLYCSGLNFAYNPHRMILNKVTDCYLTRADGERIEIQDDKLYHVVTDLYTGQMLGSVMKMSYGLLSLEPKDRDGNPIENLEDQAIMEDDRELKAWDAIARYMQSFEDTDGDGIANVPEYYETTHGRKVVEDSRNIIDLVKQPNKFSAMIAGICLIFIVIIVLVVFLIRRMIRRIKVRKGKRNSK